MQQEQSRLDNQYNRIKVELDHETQQYNKFNGPPSIEAPGPQHRKNKDILYKIGGVHTKDRERQQARPVMKKELLGNQNRSTGHSQKKANQKVQALPPNRRLEKRIYQVNDLKQMGILKNSQSI